MRDGQADDLGWEVCGFGRFCSYGVCFWLGLGEESTTALDRIAYSSYMEQGWDHIGFTDEDTEESNVEIVV